MASLTLPAPAKLNLFLHVVGRRDDGYHLLETLFQLLDFGDEVTLEACAKGEIRRAAALPGVPEDDDLGLRAARALARHAHVGAGARIAVRKRTPVGGGLGGGSSDAATVLHGLNRLWGLDLPISELAALGLELGADVPVFVHGHSALARGVGGRLEPVSLAPTWYLVACPSASVSTAAVFDSSSLTRDTPPLKIDGFPWELDTQAGLDRVWSCTRNDCEPVTRSLAPAVADAMRVLGEMGEVRMTGTGGCVFMRFPDPEAAERARARVAPELRAFTARGVNRSPLLDAVGDAARARGGARAVEWGVAKR